MRCRKDKEYIRVVKEINRLYNLADEETQSFKYLWKSDAYDTLDKMIRAMPQEAFL